MERRLTSLLAADVAGYSRLMKADQRSVIVRQRIHRTEPIDPAISEPGGRSVKTNGDGPTIKIDKTRLRSIETAPAVANIAGLM